MGSSGGHLAQLVALRAWWQDRERLWVTFRTPDAVSLLSTEDVVWAHHPTTRNLPNLVRNSWLAWRVVRRVRPDAIVSTGAAVALPFFLAGRSLGITTIYIEVYDRVDSATMTGRLCHPITDLFLVQWEEQLSLYRSAQLTGPLL